MTDPAPSPDPAHALRRASSGEQAARHIHRMIFDGELTPGMRVPQDQVAQQLGISRIPVREALIVLQHEGWVTIELHRGAFINRLDHDWVRDHYDLFGLIYGFAAEKAVERGGPQLGADLAPVVSAFARAADAAAMTGLALQFHGTVIRAAASPRLEVLLRGMAPLVPGNFFELVPGAAAIERQGFSRIHKSIVAADAEQARDQYRRLMRRQGDQVVALFEARGLLSPAAHR